MSEAEQDIVARLEDLAKGGKTEVHLILQEAAQIISWGRRRDAVLADTLTDIREEYFNLAVESARQADSHQLMDKRREARVLSEQAKNKIRYINNVLEYTGEKVLTKDPEKPKLH